MVNLNNWIIYEIINIADLVFRWSLVKKEDQWKKTDNSGKDVERHNCKPTVRDYTGTFTDCTECWRCAQYLMGELLGDPGVILKSLQTFKPKSLRKSYCRPINGRIPKAT